MKKKSSFIVAASACFMSIALSSTLSAEERIVPFREELVIPQTGVIECETLDVLKKAYPEWNKSKVWHPKLGTGKTVAHPAQVISYADKWTRSMLGDFGISACAWRGSGGPVNEKEGANKAQFNFYDYDVDGNGEVDKGEVVRSYPWSMTNPMGIRMWPFGGVFPEITSRNLYGGASVYVTHALKNGRGLKGGGFAEQGINHDHNNTWWDSRAEDHPLNIMPNAKHPDSWAQAYFVFCWKKEDFLNLSDQKYTVTFDDNSRISSTCSRVYWIGWHDVRMIVQDGDQWYISDDKQFVFPTKNGERVNGYGKRKDGSKREGISFQMKPNSATWAQYTPENYKIHFDHKNATFAPHEFKDIQAIGWYIGKDRKTIGEQAHVKWFGFGAEAVINRPEQGSVNIDMKNSSEFQAAGNEVPPFYVSTCEVPYALYKKIHKWGDAPFHSLDARYVYRYHGDMGSMTYGNKEHVQDEPVTNIQWYDALAWCNTLSEHEGKEPLYYLDPEFKNVFRGDHLATKATLPKDKISANNPTYVKNEDPHIYVKWSASGYRLPTVSEWECAAGAANAIGLKTDGTVAVGSGEPNQNGLYDMAGNVWELVWTHGDVYNPANSIITALGGGFQQTANPAEKALSKYGDTPWDGNANIGIRLVRRESGLENPKGRGPISEVTSWTFKKGERTKALSSPVVQSEPIMDMVKIPAGSFTRDRDKRNVNIHALYASKYETNYARWQSVFEWAEANGYEFSKNGDMGSMYYLGHPHSPDEPVTEITWYDVIVWCNALSEMEGKTPVFYIDEAQTQVLRKAPIYRPIKMDTKEMFNPDKSPWGEKYLGSMLNHPTDWHFIKWDADGYRIATFAEMEYMFKGGQERSMTLNPDCHWSIKNAGGTTHPVGTKKVNEYGLYDVVGNVYEWSLSMGHLTENVGYKIARPDRLNLNNPKCNETLMYGTKKAKARVVKRFFGGSWLWKCADNHYIMSEHGCYKNMYDYFPDFGFRPVRNDKGTHPADGMEEMKSPIIINLNKKHFNNLKR